MFRGVALFLNNGIFKKISVFSLICILTFVLLYNICLNFYLNLFYLDFPFVLFQSCSFSTFSLIQQKKHAKILGRQRCSRPVSI